MSNIIEPVSEAARRELVLSLAMFGVPDDIIARKVRMPLQELRRRYTQELQDGAAEGIVKALQTLYTMAVGRDADPEKSIRRIAADKDALKFYLKSVAQVARDPTGSPGKPPKQVGDETARQILKTIVGTPAEVAEFLRMRRELQAREDAEDGIIINGDPILDEHGNQVDF
jgi:alkanesulfonate monooxygenase SsuD/methylene tetrahydromethanopterin reductase-like flavin-dependent oxidoreductase (luciferase family)